MRVGVLHPGEMGVTVLESLVANGVSATWVKGGRSESTVQRASSIPSVDTLEEFSDSVETIISVCPPSAALEVARNISDKGFKGIYVDANAISPLESRKLRNYLARRLWMAESLGRRQKKRGQRGFTCLVCDLEKWSIFLKSGHSRLLLRCQIPLTQKKSQRRQL